MKDFIKHMVMDTFDLTQGGGGGGSGSEGAGGNSGGSAGGDSNSGSKDKDSQGGSGGNEGQGGGSGGNSKDSGSGSKEGGAGDWRASLHESYREEPSLANFKSLDDLAKSYVSAQKMLGDKVVVPNEKSPQSDWENFYAKVGRPKKPEEYGIKIPELSDKENAEMATVAHGLGLTKKQMEGLTAWSNKNNAARQEAFDSGNRQKAKEHMDGYIKSLGGQDKFNIEFDTAKEAFRLLADEETSKFIKESGLGQHPDIIRMFASLGCRMKEDGIKSQSGTNFGAKIEEMETKLKELEAHPGYRESGHVEHAEIVQKAYSLRSQIIEKKKNPNN